MLWIVAVFKNVGHVVFLRTATCRLLPTCFSLFFKPGKSQNFNLEYPHHPAHCRITTYIALVYVGKMLGDEFVTRVNILEAVF